MSVEKESSIFIHKQASERRSLKAKTEEIKKELRLANKAVIEVSLDSTYHLISNTAAQLQVCTHDRVYKINNGY